MVAATNNENNYVAITLHLANHFSYQQIAVFYYIISYNDLQAVQLESINMKRGQWLVTCHFSYLASEQLYSYNQRVYYGLLL